MSTRDDLRDLSRRAKPVIEALLDAADDCADFRDEARVKGLDWAQIKALLKADIQDGRDGGERIKKIVDKADLATAYADMLGLAKMTEKNNSRGEDDDAVGETTVEVSSGGRSASMKLSTLSKIAEASKPAAGRTVVERILNTVKDGGSDDGEGGAPPAGSAPPQAAPTPAAAASASPQSDLACLASEAGELELGAPSSLPASTLQGSGAPARNTEASELSLVAGESAAGGRQPMIARGVALPLEDHPGIPPEFLRGSPVCFVRSVPPEVRPP